MASIVVKLSDATKERLRQRAVRYKRSLEAEIRAILERAAQEAAPGDAGERFPDGLIRMTRPGIDLDAAIAENRSPHEGVKLFSAREISKAEGTGARLYGVFAPAYSSSRLG